MRADWLMALGLVALGCGSESGVEPGEDSGQPAGSGGSAGRDPAQVVRGFPEGNAFSWDGSWTPAPGDFPIAGLFDDEYPELPPGEWDWQDANDDKANWRNFETNTGSFEPLADGEQRQYGWRLLPAANPARFSGPAAYFLGSSGADLLDLGPSGVIHSLDVGALADGPDVLVFGESYALDYRTGSSLTGSTRDNDLVVAGCGRNDDGSFDIMTTTIHTGPGSDWVFVRDLSRAAVDLGNGDGGRTDRIDESDGDDLIVLRGNTHDFRVFGGKGSDVAIWYIDDNVQTTTWLGPGFFGDGGKGSALWGDSSGTDRLVVAIPSDTELVSATPTPNGGFMVRTSDGSFLDDTPTAHDPFATYCSECGTGPNGERTIIMEYRSADDSVFTGYFYVTGFEELQVGVGPGARAYRIDNRTAELTLLEEATLTTPPDWPVQYCE